MKTRTGKMVVVAIGIAALLFTAPALYAGSACEAPRGPYKEAGERKGRDFSKELGLTPEQQELMKQYREGSRAAMKELHEAAKAEKTALNEELKKPTLDQTAVQRIVTNMKATQGKLIDARVDNFLKMREILTPEQFAKMSEMTEKRHQKKGFGRKSWKKGNKDIGDVPVGDTPQS